MNQLGMFGATNNRTFDKEWLTFFSPNKESGSRERCRWVNERRASDSVITLAFSSCCRKMAAAAPGVVAMFKAGRGRGRAGTSGVCPFYQKANIFLEIQQQSWQPQRQRSFPAFKIGGRGESETGNSSGLGQLALSATRNIGTATVFWNIEISCPSFSSCTWMMGTVRFFHVCIYPQGLNSNSRCELVRVIQMWYSWTKISHSSTSVSCQVLPAATQCLMVLPLHKWLKFLRFKEKTLCYNTKAKPICFAIAASTSCITCPIGWSIIHTRESHTPRWQVPPLVRVHTRGNRWVFLSLSLFLCRK